MKICISDASRGIVPRLTVGIILKLSKRGYRIRPMGNGKWRTSNRIRNEEVIDENTSPVDIWNLCMYLLHETNRFKRTIPKRVKENTQ